MSRKIVVDASVARSAGTRENPVSLLCRGFLLCMRDSSHIIVMSNDISREWIRHQSIFAATWLGSMQRKGRVFHVKPSDAQVTRLTRAIDEMDRLGSRQRDALYKDRLLVLAAWETDELIASCDDKMRGLLAQLSPDLKEVGTLVWVNPAKISENAAEWLKSGARRREDRMLKHFNKN